MTENDHVMRWRPEEQRAYREAHPDKVRYWARKNALKKYGLTPKNYEAMYASQNGRCAACGEPRDSGGYNGLHVDHDHKTGKVRGLLCRSCNLGIGCAGDCPETAEKWAAYLRERA